MFTNEPTRLIIDILMHKIKIVERMDKNLNPTGRLLLSLRISKNIFMQMVGSHFFSGFQEIFLCRWLALTFSQDFKNFMQRVGSHVVSGF